MLIDFPGVQKTPVIIAHRCPGSMIEYSSISCAIRCKVRKILQFEAGAGFEPGARGVGTVYSVAVFRQLIHCGTYIAGFKLLFLSP